MTAVFLADPFQFGRGIGKGLIPFDLAPWIVDRFTDHRLQDAFLMLGIAPGKAALDARMAAIGFAVFVRNHPHQLLTAHLGPKGTAYAAIGACGHNAAVRRAYFHDFLFDECGRWTCLHTCPARHAFASHEIIAGETC